jgi:ABC-type multidrug transport system ATPase subunit
MIEVRAVSKRFGPVAALRDVTVNITSGERVAFVGSNGSGKTTLLRSILGLLRVEGTICINGVDVAKSPELALRDVAYVPQVAPPLDASVAEVVRAHACLRQIEPGRIAVRSARLGLDLAAVEKSRFRDLSGGMRQKLLAALALATSAGILICDEPTANLDATARAAFFNELSALPSSQIVILCSHRLDEVRGVVHRVLQFGEGRLVGDTSLVRGAGIHETAWTRSDVEISPEVGSRCC